MMNTMHVRRNDEETQHTVNRYADADVPVIEHGRGVQKDFKNYDDCRGRANQSHDSELEQEGEKDFYGVKTKSCRHIVIKVRMMHPVDTPEDPKGMEYDVLKIDRKIHQYQRHPKFQPSGEIELIQEAPPAFVSEESKRYRHQWKEEAGCQAVEKNDTQVSGPAEFPGKTQDSARGQDFPANHQ